MGTNDFWLGVACGALVGFGAFAGLLAAVAILGAVRRRTPVVGGFTGAAPPGEFRDGRLVEGRPDPFRGADEMYMDRQGRLGPRDPTRGGRAERSQWDDRGPGRTGGT